MSRAKHAIEQDFAGLQAHFDTVIQPRMQVLEDSRDDRKTLSKRRFYALLLLLMPVCTYVFWAHILAGMSLSRRYTFTSIFLIIGLLSCSWVADSSIRRMKVEAKVILMNGLTDYLGWRFNVRPSRPDVIQFLKDSRMFVSLRTEKYEDQISGEVLRHAFTITEAVQLSIRRFHDKDAKRDRYQYGFRGVVMSVDFPKSFFGTTILRLKDSEHRWRKLKGVKRIGFASSEFEGKYEVFGTDPAEAHFLFAPDMMVTLLDVAAIMGGTLVAAVYWNGTLNLMVRSFNRYDIGMIDIPFTDPQRLNTVRRDIKSVYYFVERVEYFLTHRNPNAFKSER